MTESRPILITTRISQAGGDAIKAYAEAEDRTLSDMVRILLKEAVAARVKQARR